MRPDPVPKALAAALMTAGFAGVELQLYASYASHGIWPPNIEGIFALASGGVAIACLLPLLAGHEAGGGATAIIAGWFVFVEFFASGQYLYAVPWLIVLCGGLLGILAYKVRMDVKSRPWIPDPSS